MPTKRIYPLAFVFAAFFALGGCVGQAERSTTETNVHVIDAEAALAAGKYLEAARHYRLASLGTTRVETLRHAAETTFEFGLDEDAEATVNRWAEVFPNDRDAIVYQGRMALRARNAEAAVDKFVLFVTLGEDQDAALDQVSQVLQVDGRPKTALAAATALAERFPDSWRAQRLLSRVALRADDENRSMEAAERAYELSPDSFQAGLLQAQAIVAGGNKSAGLEFAAEIAAGAENSDERLEYAGLLAASGESAEAMTIVDAIRQEEPENRDALKAAGLLHIRNGELETAWDELTELARDQTHQHDAMYYLANIAEGQQRNNQAMRIYGQLVDGIHAVSAQQRVAEILVRTGRSDAGIKHLEEFSARHPEYGFRLLLPRASLLRQLGRYDDALAIYDDVLAIRPESESVLLTRAETFLQSDRIDEAVAAYRDAISVHPNSAVSLNALGYTLADRTDDHEEARELIEAAISLDPDNPAIIDSLGWILFKQGNYDEALGHLERAWGLIKDPEVAAHLGETLWKLGQREKAKAILKEAYDRAPNSKPLRETLQRLLEAEAGVES